MEQFQVGQRVIVKVFWQGYGYPIYPLHYCDGVVKEVIGENYRIQIDKPVFSEYITGADNLEPDQNKTSGQNFNTAPSF